VLNPVLSFDVCFPPGSDAGERSAAAIGAVARLWALGRG
jgi:hypothetical protein